MRKLRPFLYTLLCVLSLPVFSQENDSTWTFSLDSVSIKGYRYRSQIKSTTDGTFEWDLARMGELPQFLGAADPIHYAQMLPGIQINSEYKGGINIDGCDNQHNMISIEGVPVYHAEHLLGFFSMFNNEHFSSMKVAKGATSAASPNRLGGALEVLHHQEITDSLQGVVSLGLISSNSTLNLPLDKRTDITLSFRGAYMNLFYSKWMKIEDQPIKYFFSDTNVTLRHQQNKHHLFLFDFYSGHDVGRFNNGSLWGEAEARWGNGLVALHWIFKSENDVKSKVSTYITRYKNRFGYRLKDNYYRLSSQITDYGLRCSVEKGRLHVGTDIVFHHVRPQTLERVGDFNVLDGNEQPAHAMEAFLFCNYTYPLLEKVKISGGLRGGFYIRDNHAESSILPMLGLNYDNNLWLSSSIVYALRRQFLFQTGFTDAGLPTEFWLSAGRDINSQRCHELTWSNSINLFQRRYKVVADLFYRRLYHQLAYKGTIFDYINSPYSISHSLMHGDGENYGFSLMVNKCTGNLTGWLSYTYTHARRLFEETNRNKTYPASHERPHEVKAVITYKLGKHMSFGFSGIYASGTPYTAAKSLYLLNNNIFLKYGDYNSGRLHAYGRIDVSANYKWKTGRRYEQGVNLSVYNVTSRENELFHYLSIKEAGAFAYRPVSFIVHVLPSACYYLKF